MPSFFLQQLVSVLASFTFAEQSISAMQKKVYLPLILFFLFLTCCVKAQQVQYHLKIKKGQLRSWLNTKNTEPPIISAHRGGRYYHGFPENAIETFEHTIGQTPAMIECDVELTSDSVLVLLHDRSLDRTTTGTGRIKEKPWSYVQGLHLIDDFGDTTSFRIPTLRQALRWTRKKALLELDVKRGVPFDKVVAEVVKAKVEDYVLMITYNLEDAQRVYALNNKLMISVSIRNEEELARIQEAGIPYANLIAFTGTRRSDPELYRQIHGLGILTILGTMGNIDKSAQATEKNVYQECIDAGVDVLATDYPVEAAKATGAAPKQNIRRTNYSIKRKRA